MTVSWRAMLALWLMVAASVAAEAPLHAAHRLAGARAFRAGEFARATTEFEVAWRLGARGDVSWYLGAAYLKAGRPEDAVVAFARARSEDAAAQDELLVYYEGLAALQAALPAVALDRLRQLHGSLGPRLAGEAAVAQRLATAALASEPPNHVQLLLVRVEALAAQRPAFARCLAEELLLRARDGGEAGPQAQAQAWLAQLPVTPPVRPAPLPDASSPGALVDAGGRAP